MKNQLKKLPPEFNFDTIDILKALAAAHKSLAELKGFSKLMPNKNILINAVTVIESKDSTAIENIITTDDDLFKTMSSENYETAEAKKVVSYRLALWYGYQLVLQNEFISTNMIIDIQKMIEPDKYGIRKIPGTVIMNQVTREIVHIPPEGEEVIRSYLSNLENYANHDLDETDPLIKLAVLHYQFESIHPFHDGNGRTGRILNVLYLVLRELLDSPILYLSQYIIDHKDEYYRLLSDVTLKGDWEAWVIFILKGVESTSINTIHLAQEMVELLKNTSEKIKEQLPTIYSKELVDLIFFEFYTKTNFIESNLDVSRKTASKYLNELENAGFLESEMIGRERIYKNTALFNLVKKAGKL